MLIVFFLTVLILHYVGSQYDEILGREKFTKFKNLYNKKYLNDYDEAEAYTNFIRNLMEIKELNEKSKDYYKKMGVRKYNLNRFGDQDAGVLVNRYGVTVKPYDYASNEKAHNKNQLRILKQQNLEDMKLYDLDYTEDLYGKYMAQFGKSNASQESEKEIRYYRFYKTLVELNNKKVNGEDVRWNENSDVVKHPQEFYFED